MEVSLPLIARKVFFTASSRRTWKEWNLISTIKPTAYLVDLTMSGMAIGPQHRLSHPLPILLPIPSLMIFVAFPLVRGSNLLMGTIFQFFRNRDLGRLE